MDELPPIDPVLADYYAADADVPALDQSFKARIGAGVLAATLTTPATSAAASAQTAAKVLTAKGAVALGVLTFLGGALTGVGATVAISGRPGTPPVTEEGPVEPSPATHRSVDPPAPTPEPRTAQPPSPPASPQTAAPPPIAPASRAVTTNLPAERPRTGRPGDSLREERRLLEATRAALARGHLEHARVLLARHETRYPDGEHSEERQSLTVEAALASERWDEVDLLGRRFLRAYPSSLYRSRVTRLMRDARERSHVSDDPHDRNPSADTRDVEPPPSEPSRDGPTNHKE